MQTEPEIIDGGLKLYVSPNGAQGLLQRESDDCVLFVCRRCGGYTWMPMGFCEAKVKRCCVDGVPEAPTPLEARTYAREHGGL